MALFNMKHVMEKERFISMDLMRRTGSALAGLGLVASTVFISVVLLLSVFSTIVFPIFRDENMVLVPLVGEGFFFCIAGVVFAFVLITGALALRRLLASAPEGLSIALGLCFSFVFGYWIVSMQGSVSSDFPDSYRLLKFAQEAAGGDWSTFTDSAAVTKLSEIPDDAHLYFTQYPFQSGVFLYFYVVCRFFPGNPVVALQTINVLSNCVAIAALYALSSLFLDKKVDRLTLLLLLCLCLPLHISALLPYGNGFGFALGCLFLLFQGRALCSCNRRSALRWIIASAPLLAGTLIIKSTFVLFAIAALLAWVVRAFVKRDVLLVGLCLLTVFTASAASSLPQNILESKTGLDFGDGMPKTSWFVLGLTESTNLKDAPGWWDPQAFDILYQTNGDMDEQNELVGTILSERMGDFLSDPSYAIGFFTKKLSSEWADPTFQSFYYAGLNVNRTGDHMDPYGFLAAEWPALPLVAMMDGFQIMIYALALVALVSEMKSLLRARLDGISILYAAVFFTGFGCYLLWEAKGVYLLPFFVLLIPLAVRGIRVLASILPSLTHDNLECLEREASIQKCIPLV